MQNVTGSLSAWFIVWFVTSHCVEFAFYLRVTRVAHGWARTLAAYVAGFLLPFAACFHFANPRLTIPQFHGGTQDSFGAFAVGYVLFFGLWSLVMMAMSRGAYGRRIFAVLVCGVHQVGAFVLSLLFLHRLSALGGVLSVGMMAGMGLLLLRFGIPAVLKMDETAGWRALNITAVMNFVLLYVTGIWPAYVPVGTAEDVVRFLVANVVAVTYFPVALAFAERQRTAAALALVERSMQLMSSEVAARRAAIDEARRQRHDRRHHRIVLAEHLLRGRTDRALAYLEELDGEADRASAAKFVWCENDTINAILSGYARRAEARGIAFEVTANVERTVALPDVDLVAVVANLIENAINAAGIVEDRGERRAVTVALRQRERTIGMTVTNPVPEGFALAETGLPCAEPGVGLDSVRRVIDRYQGELVYTLKGGALECQAMMRIAERG